MSDTNRFDIGPIVARPRFCRCRCIASNSRLLSSTYNMSFLARNSNRIIENNARERWVHHDTGSCHALHLLCYSTREFGIIPNGFATTITFTRGGHCHAMIALTKYVSRTNAIFVQIDSEHHVVTRKTRPQS
jgi:hypothetical protein